MMNTTKYFSVAIRVAFAVLTFPFLLSSATASTADSGPAEQECPYSLAALGIIDLKYNPAYLTLADIDGENSLFISSFYNVAISNIHTGMSMGPPIAIPFERDLVARIAGIDGLVEQQDPQEFFSAAEPEELTDIFLAGPPKTVYPNDAILAPEGVFPFQAIVIPQGFLIGAPVPGRLTAINMDDPARTEFIIHESEENPPFSWMNPWDPDNMPRFYHSVLFYDVDNDGWLWPPCGSQFLSTPW
jgi:hypothetical protein